MLVSAIPNTLSRRSGEWSHGVVCSKERFEGNDQGNKRKSEESKGKMQRKEKWVETGHCFEVREVHNLVSRIPNAFHPLELSLVSLKLLSIGGWGSDAKSARRLIPD